MAIVRDGPQVYQHMAQNGMTRAYLVHNVANMCAITLGIAMQDLTDNKCVVEL